MITPLRRVNAPPWIWSFVGALAVWLTAIAFSSGLGGGQLLSTALSFSTFYVLVGIGQMFVIASGPGNIDLSQPFIIVLGGLVAMKIMNGHDAMLIPGVAGACATGLLCGVLNTVVIRLLAIPPIIATLSTNLILESLAIAYGRGLLVEPPALLVTATTIRILGIPLSALGVLLLTLLLSVVLRRSLYGRALQAVGQNQRAAWLSNFDIGRTRLITYVISGVLASLCGVMLAGFSGGASLDMGNDYLLASIALVVIGGTSVAGGKANLPGIWGASLFLYLLVAMLNSLDLGPGLRLFLSGVIIIGIVTFAGGDEG